MSTSPSATMRAGGRMAAHEARAFHESLRGGQQPGKLTVSLEGVEWKGERASIGMPLDGLRVELGGATDKMLFFTHPDRDGWAVTTPDLSLLAHPPIAAHPPVAKIAR